MKQLIAAAIALVLLTFSGEAFGQSPQKLTDEQYAEVEKLFVDGNTLLEGKKFADALLKYRTALKLLPDDPAILYNGGFAAMLSGDNTYAAELLGKLKTIEPDNWQVRTKLIQVYQRLSKTSDRDRERSELINLRKEGKVKDLVEQREFCRDRFHLGGREVMAFEYFEFEDPRAVRYAFRILDETGENEAYVISLGSYSMTNAIWRETTKPKPKEGVRLFHLDGYYRNGGHATFGMFPGEPSYDETKKMVTDIIEKRSKPISATIPAGSGSEKP